MKRRLRLKRETVRNLTSSHLRGINGGLPTRDPTDTCFPALCVTYTCQERGCTSIDPLACKVTEDPDTGKAGSLFGC